MPSLLQFKIGLIRGVASLEGDSLVFDNLRVSEIWSDKRVGL